MLSLKASTGSSLLCRSRSKGSRSGRHRADDQQKVVALVLDGGVDVGCCSSLSAMSECGAFSSPGDGAAYRPAKVISLDRRVRSRPPTRPDENRVLHGDWGFRQ